MSRCATFDGEALLAAGGDLDPERLRAFNAHLDSCSSCSHQVADYKAVTALARGAFRRDLELPAGVRYSIAAEAAEGVARASWWSRIAGRMASVGGGHRPAWAAASLAAVLVAVAAGPVLLRRHVPLEPRSEEAVIIDMQMQRDGLRLAWRDGHEASYTVRKGTDPRDLARAETHLVKGNVWVDSQPQSSPLVVYTIE